MTGGRITKMAKPKFIDEILAGVEEPEKYMKTGWRIKEYQIEKLNEIANEKGLKTTTLVVAIFDHYLKKIEEEKA
jgi:hypothetical protein